MSEVWKDLNGYDSPCKVSDQGRIQRLNKENEWVFIGRSFTDNNWTYKYVGLSKNGVRKPYAIHRLVCKAFHLNHENKPYVNHINRNKIDNKASNLEWCTPKENVHHWQDSEGIERKYNNK